MLAALSDTILGRRPRMLAALPGDSPMLRDESTDQGLGFMLVGFGRLREARDLADKIAARSPGTAAGLLGWPVALGLAPPSSAGTRVDSLMALEKERLGNPRRVAYVEVVDAIVHGRPKEGVRLATEGMRAPDHTGDSTRNRGMLLAAAGWARLVQGDTTRGIADLREGLSLTAAPASGEAAFLRFQLALALAANGRTRAEGITYLRHGFNDPAVFLMPLAYLALGRTYEAAGKADSAAIAYGRYLRLWDKADPDLQGRVTEVREALGRLTSELR